MTTSDGQSDWDPGTYARFRGHRVRPALDLIRALPPLPGGDVIDLGCGDGAAGQALAELGRRLIGVDGSPAMLDKARGGTHDALVQADIADWTPDRPPALIFSNAALHWLPDHAALLPRLAGLLAPGGVLAVQVPHQNNAPSHRLWVTLADEMFPGAVDHAALPGTLGGPAYHRLLAPLGDLDLWETEYYQALPAGDGGHPVRRFTEATYARPILNAVGPTGAARLISAYEGAISSIYPRDAAGGVLFPFRRLFFTLRRPG